MAISRKSFSTPSSTAGILGVGSGSSGGIKMSPKFVLIAAIIFIIIVYVLGITTQSTV